MVRVDENKNPLLTWILGRVTKNQNCLAVTCGPTGSGKSYACLRLAELLDPDFDVSRVAFRSADFLRLVQNSAGKLRPGNVLIWDEQQIDHNSTAFMSRQARVINATLSTFRHKNYIVLTTSPLLSMVNATARKLFHLYIEMVGINYQLGQSLIKPFRVQTNTRTGKSYYKYLRVRSQDGKVRPLKRVWVRLPSPALLQAYEAKKERFTKDLNRELLRELEAANARRSRPLTRRQEEIVELLREHSAENASKVLGISLRAMYDHMGRIRKKGVRFVAERDAQQKVLRYEVEV